MAGTRDRLESMPPWDASAYFQVIQEVSVALAGAGQLLIRADPMRVALMISTSSAAPVPVSFSAAGAVLGTGLYVSNASWPLLLLFAETGPLCQHEWYVGTGAGNRVTAYAVSLTRWPKVAIPKRKVKRAQSTKRK